MAQDPILSLAFCAKPVGKEYLRAAISDRRDEMRRLQEEVDLLEAALLRQEVRAERDPPLPVKELR